MSELFSLQGKLYAATRDAVTGKASNHIWLGNVPEAKLELTTEKSDKFESFSGNRLLYGSLQKSKGVSFSATLDEFLPENIALGLYGSKSDVATGTVTAEAFPSGLVAGNRVQLANKFATSIVVKDSTGSPLTLALNTNYKVISAAAGIIEIVLPTGFVQPFKADYTKGDASRVVMFSNVTPPQRYIVFDGINTVTGDKWIVELYRIQFDPIKDFGLINEDWGGLQLSGNALYDEVNDLDALLGGFGRVHINKLYT